MINYAKSGIGMIVLAGILAYGLQIPFLGFFQDDWNFVYYHILNGTQGLMDLMAIDGRPGGVWVYALGFNILGYNPALWQLFSITFRILTAIIVWPILNRFWPERRDGNLVTAILFLLYPFFTLQPLSISFAQHYVAYFLLGLSFLLTIRSRQCFSLLLICSRLNILWASKFSGRSLSGTSLVAEKDRHGN
jgi:predicted membrane-bound dolichyl-phosphate-mannose-protein mannosyltransferase